MKTKIQSRLMVVVLSLLVCLAFVPMAAFAVEDNPEPGTDATVEEPAQGTDEETEEPDVGDQGDEENPDGDQVDPENPDGDQVDPENPDGDEQEEQENPKVKYKITFDPNGGKWKDSTEKLILSVEELGEFIFPEAPTREGYTFLGWGETKIKPGTKEVVVFGDKTFKAMWKKNDATPKTGDNAMPYVYVLGLLTAASAMFILRAKKVK